MRQTRIDVPASADHMERSAPNELLRVHDGPHHKTAVLLTEADHLSALGHAQYRVHALDRELPDRSLLGHWVTSPTPQPPASDTTDAFKPCAYALTTMNASRSRTWSSTGKRSTRPCASWYCSMICRCDRTNLNSGVGCCDSMWASAAPMTTSSPPDCVQSHSKHSAVVSSPP